MARQFCRKKGHGRSRGAITRVPADSKFGPTLIIGSNAFDVGPEQIGVPDTADTLAKIPGRSQCPKALNISAKKRFATQHQLEAVMAGWIVEVGPGIALPYPADPGDEEPWQRRERRPRYLPPQAIEGDYAIFMRKAAVEITYEDEKYLIVPNGALLALIREDLSSTGPDVSLPGTPD